MVEGVWGTILVLVALAVGGYIGYMVNESMKPSENVQPVGSVVSGTKKKKRRKSGSKSKSKWKSRSRSGSKSKSHSKNKKKRKSRSRSKNKKKKEKTQKSSQRATPAGAPDPLDQPQEMPAPFQNGTLPPIEPLENSPPQSNVAQPQESMQPFQNVKP